MEYNCFEKRCLSILLMAEMYINYAFTIWCSESCECLRLVAGNFKCVNAVSMSGWKL